MYKKITCKNYPTVKFVHLGLENKKIVLIISGSIAVYKSILLLRELQKIYPNIQIKIVMTQSAQEFVTPLTFQAILGDKVYTDYFSSELEANGMGHIELAKWADLILICPASANIIARIAGGLADDLASSIILATPHKVFIAPAMNMFMWQNETTQNNIRKIENRKNFNIITPEIGEQACGDNGQGRLASIDAIMYELEEVSKLNYFKNKNVLISAGATKDYLDPIRFISNNSTGYFGNCIANYAHYYGANVTLLTTNTAWASSPYIKSEQVETFEQMQNALKNQITAQNKFDLFISTSAINDFSSEMNPNKIKKNQTNSLNLKLKQNKDLLAYFSPLIRKYNPQAYVVGFAAETENLTQNANHKLKTKKVDLIVGNYVSLNRGLGEVENEVMLITQSNTIKLKKDKKPNLSKALLKYILEQMN